MNNWKNNKSFMQMDPGKQHMGGASRKLSSTAKT